MKQFMNENFLLENDTAVKLYRSYAESMPVFDYHCHLSPKEIAENKRYKNITEAWLREDHYKWRAMRSNGVDEKYITGDADDKEKFLKWAETISRSIGNPLYHWVHLELRRYFGINMLLSPETAGEIWEKCNEMLQKDEFTVRRLIERSNVKVICTTDNPADSLEYHAAIAKDTGFAVKVLPAFCTDRLLRIDREDFIGWTDDLCEATGIKIRTFKDLTDALKLRMEFFHSMGCRLSDHSLEPIVFREATDMDASFVLQRALDGKHVTGEEVEKYRTRLLIFLGRQYARLGWTMQLHIGPIRNNNRRMLEKLGSDAGFDGIGDRVFTESLVKFLNELDSANELPRTILYCLNPRDNEMLASIAGCFQSSEIPGKIQFGSGWWFNDQKDGMIRQMTALANIGLLSRFVGMTTDSRSFLSYTRHEYFRRILCSLVGGWVEKGEAPDDMDMLGKMVQDICFNNAKSYFGIDF